MLASLRSQAALDRLGIAAIGGIIVAVLVWALEFTPFPLWAGFVAAILLYVWDALT